MKLTALDFKNPNNACHSLRIVSELVRSGALKVNLANVNEADEKGPAVLSLEIEQQGLGG